MHCSTRVLLLILGVAFGGCAQPRNAVVGNSVVAPIGSTQTPRLFHPGNMQSQVNSALAHDPYYDNDAGPEVVGGRPREYARPWAEPVRNHWLWDGF